MRVLATSLLLFVVVLVTRADDASQALEESPLSEHMWLYDVTSDAPLCAIMDSLDGVTIRHSFKVIGVKRYFFVVLRPDVVTSRLLDFPLGSTVKQVPVEHTSDFFKMFNVTTWGEQDTEQTLNDTILRLDTVEIHTPENTPTADYMTSMASFATLYTGAHTAVKPISYATLARYPPKIYFFEDIEDNALQNLILRGMDTVGGIGNVRITTRHIVKIPTAHYPTLLASG